jgi:hypothetical protein
MVALLNRPLYTWENPTALFEKRYTKTANRKNNEKIGIISFVSKSKPMGMVSIYASLVGHTRWQV